MKNLLLLTALFASSFYSFAQTGPGGVGSTSSNPLWLDASRLTGLNNGDPVSTFRDFSGNNKHATQATASKRGIYAASAVNGKPSINFDGTDDYFQTGAISGLNTNTITWFIAGKANNNTHLGFLISAKHTSSDMLWGTYIGESNGNQFGTHARSLGNVWRAVNTGWQPDFNILTTNWKGASGILEGYRNGAFQGSVSDASRGGGTHQFTRIGANVLNSAGSYFFNGSIAEAIAFNFNLNATQRIIVDNYLAAKYNLGMAANDKYAYKSSHGNQLAGIGRQTSADMHTEAQGTDIVRINNASDLNDGEYLLWANNGGNLFTLDQADVPSDYTINSGSRFSRVWRAGETGEAGTVTLKFYLDGVGFGRPSTYELLIDADGAFGDGNATRHITGRSYDDVNKILTFTGVNLNDGNYFTLGNSESIISVASGSWGNTATWNCNCIPETGYYTIVNDGHAVTVDADATVGTLVIRGTASLAINNSASLTISRNLDNSGTFTANTGTVVFSNSGGPQTISSASPIDFYDLTINNSSTNDTVSLASGTYTLARTLNIQDGKFNTNGNSFTMLSTGTLTSRIAPVPAGSSIIGTFAIQRFMSERAAEWHDLSSPVQSSTIADWDTKPDGTNELYLSGVNGPDGNACCPTFYSVYTYDEPTQAYIEVTSTGRVLTPGEGFLVWMADNTSTWYAKAWDTRGVPNQGNQSFAASYTSGGDPWNLMGNPFASFISWDAVHAASSYIDVTVNIMNNGTYEAYAAGSGFEIPPGQGFWVYASRSNSVVRVNETAKTANNGSTFYKVAPAELAMTIRSDINKFSNRTKIAVNENASEEFDYFDGRFRKSPNTEAPALTTYSSNEPIDLSYNSISSLNENVVIPVKAKVGVSGNYTIDFSGLENINGAYECVLFEDVKTGETIDLKNTSSYSFDIKAEDDDTRFRLHLMKSYSECDRVTASIDASEADEKITITKDFVEFRMQEAVNAKISIYNLLGQKVVEDKAVKTSSDRVYLNASHLKGIHFVVVETNNGRVSEKINFTNF